MSGDLRYVYAVVRATSADRLPPGLAGVGGGVVGTLTGGGLAAVVSPVPAADFAEAPLRTRLEDLNWLERTAREHQGVVDGLLPAGCVLPLRLATVCRGEAGVRRLLTENRERFGAAIERLDGRAEWGVKVYAEPPRGAGPAPAPGRAGSGRDYLRRRAGQQKAADASLRHAEAAVREVHASLAGAAESARLHPPQDPRLSGEQGQNLLNGAYLVRRDREAEFAALAGKLAGQAAGLRVRLSGPWAPYSFTAAVAGGEPQEAR